MQSTLHSTAGAQCVKAARGRNTPSSTEPSVRRPPKHARAPLVVSTREAAAALLTIICMESVVSAVTDNTITIECSAACAVLEKRRSNNGRNLDGAAEVSHCSVSNACDCDIVTGSRSSATTRTRPCWRSAPSGSRGSRTRHPHLLEQLLSDRGAAGRGRAEACRS